MVTFLAEFNESGTEVIDNFLKDLLVTDFFEEDSEAFAALRNVTIVQISYQCNPEHVRIRCEGFLSSIAIIPGLLVLHNISAVLFMESEQQPVSISLNGNWIIADMEVYIELSYQPATNRFSIIIARNRVRGCYSIPEH